jgi:DNA repair exonuclease SbcCD nuclease subunit
MDIAISADLHLSESHPERLESFKVLLDQLRSRDIHILIVAGDLFDKEYHGYAGVDELAAAFPQLHLLLIPGNHDPGLKQALFASPNIQVFSQPTLKSIDGRTLLLLPYRENATMGQVIASAGVSKRLERSEWVLVSHGDFGAPRRDENGLEIGYYPLTWEDLQRFQPAAVVLGHIHAPSTLEGPVVTPGSPYPVGIDETGQRRVLVLDTATARLRELPLEHPPLNLRAELFIVPDGKEAAQIESQLDLFLKNAEQSYSGNDFSGRLSMRIILRGCTASRRKIGSRIDSYLKKRGIRSSGVEMDSLKIAEDESLANLARQAEERIARLQLDYEDPERLRSVVLEKAMQMIYSV